MVNVILTQIDESLKIDNLVDGTISLQKLKIWPGWTHRHFKEILTYEFGGKKYILPVVMSKKYTFDVISQLVNDVLNANDDQIVDLYHNNGRVTWRIYPQQKPDNPKISSGMTAFLRPSNIKLSDEIVTLFKLKGAQADKHGIITGEPVDKSSLSFCFSDASTIFFTCDQCDETTLVKNNKTKTITALPVAAGIDGCLTAGAATTSFHSNLTNRFTFHIQDERGNNLPIKRLFCQLEINEQRLRREDLSTGTGECTCTN